MTTTPTAQNWQLSTAGPGYVVEGVDDIAQSIILILTTEKGSDPMRPSFGADISRHVDRPLPLAAANIKREIISAVNLWEPRIVLKSVRHKVAAENRLDFLVGWQLVGGETSGEVSVTFGDFAPATSSTPSSALTTFINPTITPVLIKSLNWQLDITGPGRVVQGLKDIGQSILLIASTMKGTDPLRPTFGCGLFDWIDRPVNVAAVNMAREIRDAVNLWEPRVKVLSVKYKLQDERGEQKRFPAGVRFEIGWRLRGGDVKGQTELLLGIYDEYLNDVLNGPLVQNIYFILATENLDPILTEAEFEILL